MSERTQTAQQFEHYEPFDEKAALRNQIARTRADLGETIEELAARTDVKARASQMVSDVRSRAKDAVRTRARRAMARTQSAALQGATSVGSGVERASRGATAASRRARATVFAGASAGALAGYGVFEMIRRRRQGAPMRGWR